MERVSMWLRCPSHAIASPHVPSLSLSYLFPCRLVFNSLAHTRTCLTSLPFTATLSLSLSAAKITRFEDLWCLHSFGFRGEALSSLSNVAHLTIISRTPEQVLLFYFIFFFFSSLLLMAAILFFPLVHIFVHIHSMSSLSHLHANTYTYTHTCTFTHTQPCAYTSKYENGEMVAVTSPAQTQLRRPRPCAGDVGTSILG